MKKAADELKISESGVAKSLFFCALKGYSISRAGSFPEAPPGYNLKKTTVQESREKGVIQWWHRYETSAEDLEKFVSLLEKRTPATPDIKLNSKINSDKMVEWNLVDQHIGMHAWAKETGESYDIKIAQHLVVKSAKKIFGETGKVDQVVINLGGDLLHSDNRSSETEKNRNRLDTDSRYTKVVECAETSIITAINISAKLANKVEVKVLSGNHDFHSAIWLSRVLNAYYRDNKRINIDVSPMKHKFFRFGNSFFCYTHGDNHIVKRVHTYMLNQIIKQNLQGIEYKYARIAHEHKRNKKIPDGLVESDGVIIETFPTLAAQEAYGTEAGYQNIRATKANFIDKNFGQIGNREIKLKELI